jgi:hypothetical protein
MKEFDPPAGGGTRKLSSHDRRRESGTALKGNQR